MKSSRHASETRWPAFLRWPSFLIANAAIVLLVGVSTLRETYHGWTIDREIRTLTAQAETLEGRKIKLQELTEALASPGTVEFEARKRLGWKKPGERVIVLSGYEAPAGTSSDALFAPSPDTVAEERSNPARWRDYFFH